MMKEVRKAGDVHIEGIVSLDERIIDSRAREAMLRQAVQEGRCHVVLVEGKVVGFGIMHYHFYGLGFVELIIVDPDYRRQGIATLLLEEFKQTCTTEKLFTSTNTSNVRMQLVLEKSGFVKCGHIDKLDEGDPELVYCYELNK
jgi:ribosomal protein S18 acetylase RimI-like enzyme